MKIKVTPQLRALSIFLSTVIRDLNTWSPNNFNSEDFEAVLKIPAAEEWFNNIDENNFDTSYQELEFEEALWFVFMLLQIPKYNFFNYFEGDRYHELVVYDSHTFDDDKIFLVDDEELDECSIEMFGEEFSALENDQAMKVVDSSSRKAFNFRKYVNELIEEARK
jgi:hypothetical protein